MRIVKGKLQKVWIIQNQIILTFNEVNTQPTIILILSPSDKILEAISKICLVFMWGLTFYSFIKMPTIIPIHFGASGKADHYGNKITLLLLPTIATIIYFGLTQLNKYPHLFNYLTKITKDNAHKQYSIATRLLRYLKLIILIIFSIAILSIYLTTIGVINGLGVWFLPVIFGLISIPTIFYIGQSFNKKNDVK